MSGERLRCRSTVTLARLPRGSIVNVDPDDPYMAGLLEAEVLVPEPLPDEAKEDD